MSIQSFIKLLVCYLLIEFSDVFVCIYMSVCTDGKPMHVKLAAFKAANKDVSILWNHKRCTSSIFNIEMHSLQRKVLN